MKSPAGSRHARDEDKVIATIGTDEAIRPLADGGWLFVLTPYREKRR